MHFVLARLPFIAVITETYTLAKPADLLHGKTKSRAVARKPRDAAAVLFGFILYWLSTDSETRDLE